MFQKGKAKRPLIAHSPFASINIGILERERERKRRKKRREETRGTERRGKQKPLARPWVISGTDAPKALPAAGVARRRRCSPQTSLFLMWAGRKPSSLVGFLGY